MTAGPLLYPGADHHSQWVGKGTVEMPMDNVKWLQHTTETAGGWPSYNGMGDAPTFTYEPWLHQLRQHFEINQSARALRNDVYPDVNHYDVVQMEISCYCDEQLARSVGRMDRFVEALDDHAINDLGDFGAWCEKYWGMKDAFYPAALNWPAYNGQQTVIRMTLAKFQAFSGILGHMAAPGQVHLDPSSLNNRAIQTRMGQGAKPDYPQWRDAPSPAVGVMVAKLRLAGYFGKLRGDAPNYYGVYTKNAVQRFQTAQGWTGSDADGLMGPETWKRIQALPSAPPKDPPPHQPPHDSLLDRWQQATGDTRHAQDVEVAVGEQLVKAQPHRPALAAVLGRQKERAAAEADDWKILHEAATP